MAKVEAGTRSYSFKHGCFQVLVGTCVKRGEEGDMEAAGQSVSINIKTGLPIDTYTDQSKTVFFKVHLFLYQV